MLAAGDERALFVTAGKDKEFVVDGGKRIQSIFGREVLPDGTAVKVK